MDAKVTDQVMSDSVGPKSGRPAASGWPQVAQPWVAVPQFDRLVAVVAGVFTVLWLPVFIVNTEPRNALALCLLPVGMGFMILRARQGAPSQIMALACCLVFVVAGVTAVAPRVAFVGQMPEWASVPALVASMAWWSVGREVTARGIELVVAALTGGALINGVVGLVQLSLRVEPTELVGFPGRASGLMFNPVFYGTFVVGVASLWIARASAQALSRWTIGLCLTLTFFAALSGSRVVLVASVISWAMSAAVWRRASLPAVAAGIGGVVGAEVFLRLVGGALSPVARLESDGASGRLEIWRFGLRAFAERPLLGWGPSNAELAVQPRIDREFAYKYWGEGVVTIWSDPHNALLFFLLSVGAVGTLLLAVFVLVGLRGRRNWSLVIAVVAMATTWALQPFTVHTLPVAMLMLGMAVRPTNTAASPAAVEPAESVAPHVGRWRTATLAAGATITIVALTAAFVVDRAIRTKDPDRAASVARVFGGDPWLDLTLSSAYKLAFADAASDPILLRKSLEYAERAAENYPTSEHYQAVADAAVIVDEIELAQRSLERAVEIQPSDPLARQRLYALATHVGDAELATAQEDALCALGDHWCPRARDGLDGEEPDDAGPSDP